MFCFTSTAVLWQLCFVLFLCVFRFDSHVGCFGFVLFRFVFAFFRFNYYYGAQLLRSFLGLQGFYFGIMNGISC